MVDRIKLLGVRKARPCNVCGRWGKAVRVAVPDTHHGVLGWTVCVKCLENWVQAAQGAKSEKQKRRPVRKPSLSKDPEWISELRELRGDEFRELRPEDFQEVDD